MMARWEVSRPKARLQVSAGQGFAGVDQQGFGVLVRVYGEERWIGGRFDHDETPKQSVRSATVRLHANRVATVRRCARPGLFRTPSRSEDLLRAAAIKQRAQKTPVEWLGVCTPKQFRRTCTSVSPFFAMTGRRLGVRTSHHTFMHSPKSCGKNPKTTSTVILPIVSKECSDRLFGLLLGTRLSSLFHPNRATGRHHESDR